MSLLDLLTVSLAAEHDDHDIKSIIPSMTRHLLNFTIPRFSRIVVFGGVDSTGNENEHVLYYDYFENVWSVDPVKLTIDNTIAAKYSSPPTVDGTVFVVGTGRTGKSQDVYRVSPVMSTPAAGLNPCFERIDVGVFKNTGPFYRFEGGISAMVSLSGLHIITDNGDVYFHNLYYITSSTCIPIGKTKLLFMGGIQYYGKRLKTCLMFDSVELNIALVEPMNYERLRHSACILPNGNVFICGGVTHQYSCEEYDVERNRWILRNVKVDMLMHACVSLGDGRVFIVGGGSKTLIYDSTKNKVSAGPDMPFPVYNPIIAMGEALD